MITKVTGSFNQYRDLLHMLTLREIRVKYKQSVMGLLWAILMPMFVISAGILVRFAMAELSGKAVVVKEIVTISVKALPWSFFVASIRFATNSLTADTNLVTKVYFPREILPFSSVLSQVFDLMIASVILAIILTAMGMGVSIFLLWVPCLLLLLILQATALGLLLSAMNLFFRDVKFIVDVVVTFAIFFTPVFYDASIAGRYEWVLLLNPVAPILEGLNRAIVLHRSPDLPWVLYSGGVALFGFFSAMAVFKKLEPKFAESI